MDLMLLMGLGGALVLGVMMLVVVMIARSLDKAPVPKEAGADTGKAILKIAETLAARTGAADPAKVGKQVQTVVAVVASIFVVGGIVGFLGEMGEDAAPVASEIAAGALAGTLLSARDRDPVVLIVPGSGPTDRDGNSPMGVATNAYSLLAEALAEERIATVRIDKRGMFGSAGAGDPNAVTPADYVADIHAWIDAIRQARGSDCVFLLGHSEGALMVSLAAEGRDDVCGLMLVSGMGRRMGDVIREQLISNPANAPLLDQAVAALAELEAGRQVDVAAMDPALIPLFAPQVQGYLIATLSLDPVEALRRANKRTLILQGTTDLQVGVADARLLDKAPRTRLRLIEGMNHVLKEAPADRAANLATYADPSLPLAPGLVRRIEDFVKDND